MNNEKQLQLVNFEQAKKLEKIGFDASEYNCYATYNQQGNLSVYSSFQRGFSQDADYFAPTVALALKYCEDVKKIIFRVAPVVDYDYDYDNESYVIDGYLLSFHTNIGWELVDDEPLDRSRAYSLLLDKILDYLIKKQNEKWKII